MDQNTLLEGILRRQRAAVSRGISLVEREDPAAGPLLCQLRGNVGRAHRVGVTGPPGAGKSTLLGALAGSLAERGESIGVLAVDPTSPFTHGAVLGDRVRMADLDQSDRIFIRSMASRGQGGGLSPRAADAADVLDAAGYPWLFIESVGVGQVELDIRHVVDTTIVVLVPESGDQIQAIKAGLMEIADLYVVNKCDHAGADAMLAAVRSCVSLQHHPDPDWMPGIFGASATARQGIAGILAELQRHRAHLSAQGRLQQRRRAGMAARLAGIVKHHVAARLGSSVRTGQLDSAVEKALSGAESPDEIARDWLACWLARGGGGA
ncbi:MAG: methylmalonyl Co-A mutase-associated GTPase MeaB [Gammaproteobacteria bacterium]|nr:methylmalonyl Co-A mutase-associated GTPase MeaB [Gammaproteobacteria bacterium]